VSLPAFSDDRDPPRERTAPGAERGLELRERARGLGPDRLDAWELLTLVLGSRRSGEQALRLLERSDLVELSRSSPRELERSLELSAGEAARVAAAFALGRRVSGHVRPPRGPLRSAVLVHRLLEAELRGLERETFHVLLLDGKHALRRREAISVGTLTTSLVHPREVFRLAVRESAAAVICAHNHPSGDPEPSAEDVEVTRRLIQAGTLLGVPLLDHVVIGEGRFVSLRERMGF
jgi:DNA repair protein RadC